MGTEFIVVLDGDVEVRDGDRVVATRGPGDHLGEIALLGMRRQTATAVATSPVEVAVMSTGDFLCLLGEAPELVPEFRITMTRRLLELARDYRTRTVSVSRPERITVPPASLVSVP